jgi:hypothetical protein
VLDDGLIYFGREPPGSECDEDEEECDEENEDPPAEAPELLECEL